MRSWKWWNGERLVSGPSAPVAFDTETEVVEDPLLVPRMALGMAFDGTQLVLIHPSKIDGFLQVNKGCHLVGHNLAFDWWVCHEIANPFTRRVLWDLAATSRLHDTMILDNLVRLADIGHCHNRDLGEVSAEYLGQDQKADKENPYRLRFGELLGMSESEIEQHPEFLGFAEYALSDVIVTWKLYQAIHAAALKIVQEHKTETKWGLLTEAIQVRASISFALLSRTPVHIDLEKQQNMEENARRAIAQQVDKLTLECPALWKRDRQGQVKTTPKTEIPQMDFKVLREHLTDLAHDFGFPMEVSSGKKGWVSVAPSAWGQHAGKDATGFIKAWVELEAQAKTLEFLVAVRAEKIWTRYNILKVTGRTSAASHKKGNVPGCNIQQIPRDGEMRSLFVPALGYKWASVDYSYIELRTLAATCELRFGKSALADAVREHTAAVLAGRKDVPDPHQRTGAGLLGVTVEEFLKLPKEEQKLWRQRAKPVNFGYPGGLGAARFVGYAGGEYGLEVSIEEAVKFKKAWVATYPEMEKHLADDTMDCLARASGIKVEIWRGLFGVNAWGLQKALTGKTPGVTYWKKIDLLIPKMKPEFAVLIKDRNHDEIGLALWKARRAFTNTGRVRAGVNYTDAKNTPFQGLAADGAKEALFELLRCGHRVIAFVHDEMCLEIRSDTELTKIQKIMNVQMEKVLGGRIPSMTEAKSGPCWAK